MPGLAFHSIYESQAEDPRVRRYRRPRANVDKWQSGMQSDILRESPRGAAPAALLAPPRRVRETPRSSPIATCLAIAALPVAGAVAFHALTAGLPFDLE